MILTFPGFDTLRLVVAGAFVPAEILRAEAAYALLPEGGVTVEGAGKLTRKQSADLAKLNVRPVKAMPNGASAVSCWYQILPLAPDPRAALLADQAPVLFELTTTADLSAMVTEMLRLGNDRQSFRWFADGDSQRVLLRVVGPPYYTLLRAIDRLPGEGGGVIRAYIERSSRVWVQIGFSHPLADALQAADDQLVLLRPGREWTYLADEPFRDVYEVIDFKLPAEVAEWTAVPDVAPFDVALKLVPGNAAEAPEFWVFQADAADALDAFVRDADERVAQRLRFAVGTVADGTTWVALRVAASKVALPVLALPRGVGFKSYQRLPNLFVPVGTRLHPQLRRDTVRGLLAADTNRTVWLMPGPAGTFWPESIEESAFRPLEEWVDYQIAEAQEPLRAWVAASRFEFQSFQCHETGGPKPMGPEDRPRGERLGVKKPSDAKVRDANPESVPATASGFQPASPEAVPAGEWHRLRSELQERFLAAPGTLDDPAKTDLWPDMARANAGAGDVHDAAVCWLNALWTHDDPPPAFATGWLAAEGIPTLAEADFTARLRAPDPTATDVRAFAAAVIAASLDPPPWLEKYLPDVQRVFEERDGALPVRAAWLVGDRLARLAGGDPLGLARLRDRLLGRLLEDGLNAEIDLPFFLRNSDNGDTEAARSVRRGMHDLLALVRRWAERAAVTTAAQHSAGNAQTMPYIDLLFAFAFARLGESKAARELMDAARGPLAADGAEEKFRIAGDFLFGAFRSRIETAIAGRPNAGPLDAALLADLAAIQARSEGVSNSPSGIAHYVISRMREESRVLEPVERIAPYEKWNALDAEVLRLPDLRGAGEFAAEVRRLFRKVGGEKDALAAAHGNARLLKAALRLAHLAGEAFAAELIGRIPAAFQVAGGDDPVLAAAQAMVLERGLFLAAHYDRREQARGLMDLFLATLARRTGDARTEWVALVARQGLRSLRKLGLRDEAAALLARLRSELLGSLTPDQWKARHATDPRRWAAELRAALAVAGGQLRFGDAEAAASILDLARGELTAKTTRLPHREFTAVAEAYIAAVGEGPVGSALPRIAALFEAMNPAHVAVTYTTAPFYSRLHLNLAEAAVLAVAGDDSALAAGGRRWLEEDEAIVRRRIHRDLRRQLPPP